LLLLDLCPCDHFINFGSGIGYSLPFVAMAHPLCHIIGVEVMAPCNNITVEALYKLSWLITNLEDYMLLVLNDVTSPQVKISIDSPKLSVIFMSNKLLPKRLHHVLVELILRASQNIKCQQALLHFRNMFGSCFKMLSGGQNLHNF
jgi:hypothetical protein